MTDVELLRQYREGNHDAFAVLVKRHADWVYSVALRHVCGDRHLAEDVMQAAFIVLARDIRTGRTANTALNAWLFKVVRFTALTAMRGESRRRRHERKAASMTPEATSHAAPEAPIKGTRLDELIAKLRERDRQAVLLRFYHRKDIPEIARELGVSETAARKRLERAVDKLREMFRRISGAASLAPAVMVEAALTSNVQAAPESAVNALTSILSKTMPAELGTSSAALLACDVIGRVNAAARLRAIIGTAAAVVLSLLVASTVTTSFRHETSANFGRSNVSPITAKTRTHSGPLRVGILVSHATATKPAETTQPASHRLTDVAVKALHDPSMDLYAVIEPGTAKLPDMVEVLAEHFEAGHVIDGADPRALATLDVLVTFATTNMRPEVLKAMREAVTGGVGYLRVQDLGCASPGRGEDINSLLGISRIGCFWRPLRTKCQVVAPEHPLLAGLVADDSLDALPIGSFSGSFGAVNGQPLIAAKGAGNRYSGIPGRLYSPVDLDMRGHTFYPMIVSQLGEGKMVACQWYRVPPAIDKATHGRFYIRCVNWLGGRPLD
jgi:RNA polymerase sigma factor (sigma-70 family)